MVFKPNYNLQRAERNRAKQAKKEEKQRDKEQAAAKRKAELEAGTPVAESDETSPEDTSPAV